METAGDDKQRPGSGSRGRGAGKAGWKKEGTKAEQLHPAAAWKQLAGLGDAAGIAGWKKEGTIAEPLSLADAWKQLTSLGNVVDGMG